MNKTKQLRHLIAAKKLEFIIEAQDGLSARDNNERDIITLDEVFLLQWAEELQHTEQKYFPSREAVSVERL